MNFLWDATVARYKSEHSQKQYERQVNELDRKSRDRVHHMDYVVNHENIAVADLTRRIRMAATREGAIQFKDAVEQTKKAVGREFGRQQKELEDLIRSTDQQKREFENSIHQSKKDYAELARTSDAIRHNREAQAKIDHAKRFTGKDIYTLDSLRAQVRRVLDRTIRQGEKLTQAFRQSNPYGLAGNADIYMGSAANHRMLFEVDRAVGQIKESHKREQDYDSGNPPEVSDEVLGPRAKREIKRRDAEIEELEARLKGGLPQQVSRQDFADIIEKPKPNYGRRSLISEGQENIYKQRDTYE